MTMTAPWDEQAPDALREPLTHLATLAVVTPDGTELPLDPHRSGGTVTFDEAWSPHVEARVTVVVPTDQGTLDALDPRAGARLVVRAGYRYPSGREDVHELADLCLRSRPVRRPASTADLTAHSDEVRLQDTTPLGDTRTLAGTMAVRAALGDLITWALPGTTVALEATSTETLGDPLTVTTGADLWGTLADLADRINAWVYVDGQRTWRVVDRPALAGVSAYQLEVGPAGTLTDTTSDLSMGEWGNAVLVEYPDGTSVWAKATTGDLAVGTAPTKVVKVTRSADGGSPAARKAVAQAVLRRALSRGRGFTLTAPAAYWLRPGHTITAALPTGPQERHLVARVAFDLATGAMTVTTRVPDDGATILTGA